MKSCNGSLSLVLLLSHLLVVSVTLTAAGHICYTAGNFTTNSAYGQNRDDILLSLSSNMTVTNGGFYTATLGQGSGKVHALALCGGEVKVTIETCKNCVASIAENITNTCPNQKEAFLWGDGGVPTCVVRYSNRSIFGVKEVKPFLALYATANLSSNMSGIDEIWTSFMSTVVTEAAMGSSKLKFASKEKNLTGSEKIYAWGQCTPDLSQSDCGECLQESLSYFRSCCIGHGGIVYRPSCMMRSDAYPIYEYTTSSPAPLPAPPPPSTNTTTGRDAGKIIAIVVPIAAAVVIIFTLCYCCLRRRTKTKYDAVKEDSAVVDMSTPESLQFDLSTIQAATNNFSDENKIGEGGFGDVYKGILSNGQLIAVKRLSRSSGQGAEEFKNEAVLVAKLQHRNLVRLFGFCLEGEEKILVYEFVPNKSLDYFLFDSEKRGQLNWSRRYKIIQGIARGILYLHEDSRLRIIHRDLKASNILLDGDMNPKISDFGMARIFGVDQTQGNTNRIVGTYGYMSPEYAMQGQFSVKSDVYSFGVLVLEIISGKKNSTFYESDCAEDLLSHAWKLWRDGSPLEFIDPTLKTSYARDEVIRSIHIGLLCVQEDVDDRPTMASIGLMLTSLSTSLQLPQQPAFIVRTRTGSSMPMKGLESDQSTSKSIPCSVNEVSITELYPR